MACCLNVQGSIESGDLDLKALAFRESTSSGKKESNATVWTVDGLESQGFDDDSGNSNSPSSTSVTTNEKFLLWTSLMTAARNKDDSGSRWDLARGRLSRWSRRRSSIKDRSTGGGGCAGAQRRAALRQRSMSLDAAEDLWASAKDAAELLHPSGSPSTSPNLREQIAKTNRILRRSHRFGGSLYKNRKNIITGEVTGSKEKQKRVSDNIQALFEAVEDGDLVRVQDILTETELKDLDINRVNSDDLTCLDTAMLTNHSSIARLLILHGAQENRKLKESVGQMENHIETLYSEAEQRVTDLRLVLNSNLSTSNNSSSLQKENEKSLIHWQLRKNLFNQMKAVLHSSSPPKEPENVTLSVSSESSILVTFLEPADRSHGLATHYRVDWSKTEKFENVCGFKIVDEPDLEVTTNERFGYRINISNLSQGTLYYIRVSAGNFSGYSRRVSSSPSCGRPSNWKELDGLKPRCGGKIQLMDQLFKDLKNLRLPDAAEIKDEMICNRMSVPARKLTVKKSLKYIFSASPKKFLRTVKRGVYLAALICCDDRILVTYEDTIPVIEVHEEFSPSSVFSDYYWLIKIACTWKDVKSLRSDLEKSSSSGSMQFRYRLLQAISLLQSAVGVQDLGQFYHKPIRDNAGAIVLTTIKCVKTTKHISLGQFMRWMPISKVSRRSGETTSGFEPTALDILLESTQDLIDYHKTSSKPIGRGLYLGYLKLYSSMELIQIMTPQEISNVLPHIKIRDCSNVTREEWQWLKKLDSNKELAEKPSQAQINFQLDIASACIKLLNDLGESDFDSHRIYDMEVIEISSEVSFILILPRVHSVCALPGQTEQANLGCKMLPVQVFEMIHMRTYQFDFISRYSRLSSLLEIDIHLAQQNHRQAFSTEEMDAARRRLDQLTTFQQRLDDTWRSVRWTMDIITYARDRNLRGGIPLRQLGQNSGHLPSNIINNNICNTPSLIKEITNRIKMPVDDLLEKDDLSVLRQNKCEKKNQKLQIFIDCKILENTALNPNLLDNGSDFTNNCHRTVCDIQTKVSGHRYDICTTTKCDSKTVNNIMSENAPDAQTNSQINVKNENRDQYNGPAENYASISNHGSEHLNEFQKNKFKDLIEHTSPEFNDFQGSKCHCSSRSHAIELSTSLFQPNATVGDIIKILHKRLFPETSSASSQLERKVISVEKLCLLDENNQRLDNSLTVRNVSNNKLVLQLVSSLNRETFQDTLID